MNDLIGIALFGLYFVSGLILLLAFMAVYSWVTPHEEAKLIRENNLAAALVYAGAVIGFALAVASAMGNSISFVDFIIFGVVAGIAQILTFLIFRMRFPRISERIEQGELGAPATLAAISVAVGLLNAAALTY